MGLETATYISQLVSTNPVGGTDLYSTADDHLRLIKSVLQSQFPNFTAAAMNLTVAELNLLDGLTASAAELNVLDGFTGTAADLELMSGQAAGGLTSTEIGYLDGVTSAIQTQFDALTIGSDVQAWDADLDAIAALAKTDGNFIVGNGSTWVAESGATARTSLGAIADGDSIAGLTITGTLDVDSTLNLGSGNLALTRNANAQLEADGDCVLSHDSTTYASAKVTFSTSAPTGGADGDIWFEYVT